MRKHVGSVLGGLTALAIAFQLGNLAYTFHGNRQSAIHALEVMHTNEIIQTLTQLLASIKDAETNVRGYVITADPAFLSPYQRTVAALTDQMDAARRLTSGNPVQQARLPPLEAMVAEKLATLQRIVTARGADEALAARLIKSGAPQAQTEAITGSVAQMLATERQLLAQRKARHQATSDRSALIGSLSDIAGLAVLLLLLVAGTRLMRRRARDAALIAEQSERLRIALFNIEDGVILTDLNGRVTSLNRAAERLIGHAEADAIGQSIDSVVRLRARDDSAQPAYPVMTAIRQETMVRSTDPVVLDIGEDRPRWVDYTASVIREARGSAIGCMLILRDRTGQVLAQDQLHQAALQVRASLMASEIGVWEFDAASGRIRGDENMTRMFWLAPGEAANTAGNPYLRVVHPDDRALVLAAFDRSIRLAVPYDVRYRLVSADGTVRWVEARAKPEADARGEVVRMSGVVIDVTARHRIEAERDALLRRLGEQQRRYETALSNTPILHYIFDLDHRFQFVSAPVEQVLRRPAAEILGKDAFELGYPPAVAQRQKRHLDQVIASREPVTDRTLFAADGGRERLYEYHFVPVLGPGQRVEAVVGTTLDITERVEGERALRESEQRFRALVDSTASIVWTASASGAINTEQPRWSAYTGQDQAQLRGFGWLDAIHPHDRHAARRHWKVLSRRPRRFDRTVRIWHAASNDWRQFETRGVPLVDASGAVREWIGMCVDVEDRARAQAERTRLLILIENSPDFIGASDENLVPGYLNPAGLSMTGLRDLNAARRLRVPDFFFPEDRAFVAGELLPEVVQSGRAEAEIRFRHFVTGEAIWMLCRIFSLKDNAGRITGYATVSQNIEQRRNLENNLRNLAANLSEADRRKNEFLATLAHELRNPLAPIRSGIEILQRESRNRKIVQQATQMLARQVGQMVHLVDDLLDLSRISRGKIELRVQPLDLALVIADSVEATKPWSMTKAMRWASIRHRIRCTFWATGPVSPRCWAICSTMPPSIRTRAGASRSA
ncbi:MAG: PAS domain S-box protein [Burkholderiaceae bacterium]